MISNFSDIFNQTKQWDGFSVETLDAPLDGFYNIEYTSMQSYTHIVTKIHFKNNQDLVEEAYECNPGYIPFENTCQACSGGYYQYLNECKE